MAKAKKIKVNIYDDMRRSLADALAYERGQEVDLRVTTIPAPPKRLKPQEIRHIRDVRGVYLVVLARGSQADPSLLHSRTGHRARPAGELTFHR